MAENTENNKFWVRHITDDGNYQYYNIDGNQISSFIKEYPNAQGLMRDDSNNILPYNLTKINDVQAMNNYSLHGLSDENILKYDQEERDSIRPYRKAFEAFDKVMEKEGVKPGTPLHTLMLNMVAYESVGFTSRDGVGGHDRAKGLSQIVGGTFRDMIERGADTPITKGYWDIVNRYNGGNPISHDDLLKEEFDEAAIALGLNIMMDKLSKAKELEGIDIFAENFDAELIPYIYAKYYNTGDINGDIRHHTETIRDKQKQAQVLYDRGRRYYKNYNTLGKSEEPKIEEPKVEEPKKTPEEIAKAEEQSRIAREDEIRNNMRVLVNDAYTDVHTGDNTTGGKTPTFLESWAKTNINRNLTQTVDVQGSIKTSLENRLKVSDTATAKLYQQVHDEITPIARERAMQAIDSPEYREIKSYIDSYLPPETKEKSLKELVGGIPVNASGEDVVAYLQEQASQTQKDIDDMLASVSLEERESYFDAVESIDTFEQQEYNLAYDELMDERMQEYQGYLHEAIIDKLKPQSELEYFACQTMAQSIIGKVLLASTSEEAKNLFNEGLMSYDASGWTDFGAGLTAMILDMPVFNAGGAIANSAFKALSAASKLLTQKAILTGITKGKNVVKAVGLGNKATNATVQAGNRLAKLQLQQIRTNKLMRYGRNLLQGSVSGAGSFGFHSAASQFAYNFDVDDINWNEVGNSAILGASMSFLHPFKEMLPSAIQKKIGMPILAKMNKAGINNVGRKLQLKDLGNRALQATSRVAFIGTIEAPLFDYQSRLLNGDTSDFNYFHAMKEHSPMFVALGLPHLGKSASLVNKGKTRTLNGADYYGITSPFRAMARNPYARMEQSDYENIREATGLKVSKASDIYKLSQEQKVELDKALMSNDMPIVTRNRYLMMVGDANTSVPFALIEGDFVDHIELRQNKNGVYEYRSYDASHTLIEKKVLHGYSEAEAIVFNEMCKHNIEMQHIKSWNDYLSESYVEGAKIQQNADLQNKQSELLKKVTDKDGKRFDSMEEFEARALEIIEKQPNMRTDNEVAIVDAYTTYLYEATNLLSKVGDAANQTATALNMQRIDINRVLKLEPEQRTGADADIYEIFDAYLNGRDIPENATYKKAVAEADAVVRQLEENKQAVQPEKVTPQVEVLLMSRMNSSQRLNYINRRFVSADGSVEYVVFSDGTEAIRVQENTGNVVYRDAFGRDFTPTEAQRQEYQRKQAEGTLSDISYKVDATEAANQILETQARQAGLLKNSASKTIADAEGTVEYVKADGSIAFGNVKSIDGNGNYTLLDGTVIKSSDIRTDNTKFISERVDAAMKEDYVPAGFNASERPKESTMKTMASQDFPRFLTISKLWNPDVNMMAIIESKIAKTQADIEKLQKKLGEITNLEATSSEKFQHLRAKTEAELNRKMSDLTKIEKARDEYVANYPIDKANYDALQYEMRVEAEKKAELARQAEEKAKLAQQKANREQAGKHYEQREKERIAREKAEAEEKARAEKEERDRQFQHTKKEVEYNKIWREAEEQQAKAEDAEAERIASMTTDQKFADLHRRLNIFDGKKGINKDFSPEQHYSLMEVYFPELDKVDVDIESFKMNLDSVVSASKELANRKKKLASDLNSLSPQVSLKAKADKTTTEKMFKTAEEHLQSLLSSMESIALRMKEQGNDMYMDAVRAVKEQLAEGRTVADNVWKLLEPKKEGKPIETLNKPQKAETSKKEAPKEQSKKKDKKESVKEETKETEEKESIGEESLDVTIDTDEMDIVSALKGNKQEETTVPEPKVEEAVPVEQPVVQTEQPKDEPVQPKPIEKQAPKPKAKKNDSGLKVEFKEKKQPKTEKPKVEPTKKAKDTTPVEEAIESNVGDFSKTRFLENVKGEGINMSIRRAVNKDGKLIKSEIVEGERGSADGWTEEFDMEVNIEGIADNNNLGENWKVLEKAYNIKNGRAFINGDVVTVVKQPRIKVQVEFDGKGGKKITSTSGLTMGEIKISPLRGEAYTNENIPTIIQRLKNKGITIKWGVIGDFNSTRQQALYDAARKEIVLNRNANLTDEQIIKVVLGHEAVHSVFPNRGTKEWNSVINELSKVFEMEYSASEWAEQIKQIKEAYSREGKTIDDKVAMDELLTETMGRLLFDEAQDATIIRNAYERLLERKKELTAKAKSKNKDTEYVKSELSDCNLAIKTIETLAESYNKLFIEKPKGVLGRFWESLTSILSTKQANKQKDNSMKTDWNIENVMDRAERAIKNMHKLDKVTPEQQYDYIWKHQESEPHFKEYIEKYPERFEGFSDDSIIPLSPKSETFKNVMSRIFDNIKSQITSDMKSEYLSTTGEKEFAINKKEAYKAGTPASVVSMERLYQIFSSDAYAHQKLSEILANKDIVKFVKEFKDKLPETYQKLAEKYGDDLLLLMNETTPETVNTKSKRGAKSLKSEEDRLEQEQSEHEQENSASQFAKSNVAQRLNDYNEALFNAEKLRPKKAVTVATLTKKYGGAFKFLSQDKKSQWVKEMSVANAEYDAQMKAYEAEMARIKKEYEDVVDTDDYTDAWDGAYDTYAYRINAKKMTGVEVDNYWKAYVNNLALESKSRQELFNNAYKVISEHIANHKIGELVRTRTDLKEILNILKNISTVKDVSMAEKDKALQEVARQLDIITADVTLNTSIDALKETILETKTRISSGLNKSEKYADNEKLSFINSFKEGLKNPLEISDKIKKATKEVEILRDRWENGDLEEGETSELMESRIQDLDMRMEALETAEKLIDMRNQKRKEISNLTEQYRKAKAAITKEKASANPNTDKIVELQKIVDSYSNNKLEILQRYQKQLSIINNRFIEVESTSREALKAQKEAFKAETDEIIRKHHRNSIYGNNILGDDVKVNSTTYQNLVKDRINGINKLRNAHMKAHGSLDMLLRYLTVERASHEGYLVGEVSKWHNESQVKRNQLKTKSLEMMGESAKEYFGNQKLRKVIGEGDQLITDIDGNNVKIHRYKNVDGEYRKTAETLPTEDKNGFLTISEAVDLVFTAKQAQGRKALEKAEINMQDVLAIETILKNNPTYRKHLEYLTNLRDGVIKMLGNEAQTVHEQLFGLKYIEEMDYFPLSIAQTKANKGNVVKKNNYIGSSITPGYMISRSRLTSEYKPSNAYDKVLKYVNDMSQWIAFSPTAKKLNAVISNENFAKNIKANIGEWYYDRIKAAANIEVGTYATSFSKSLYNELFNMTKASKVAFRPLTALKQLTSGFTYLGFSADLAYQKELAKYSAIGVGTLGWQNVQWCRDNMPRFRERYEKGVAGDVFMGNLQALHASALKDFRNKAMKEGMRMNAYIDAVTIANGSRAVYEYKFKQLTKMGVTSETAKDIALRVAEHEFNLTQASNESMFLSEGQASTDSAIYKAILAFKTPVLSLWRRSEQSFVDLYRLGKGGKDFKQRRIDAYTRKYIDMGVDVATAKEAARKDYTKDYIADVLNLIGTYAIANITFTGANAFTKWLYATMKGDEENAKKFASELRDITIERAIVGGMPDVPIIGNIVTTAKEAIFDGKRLDRAFEDNLGTSIFEIPLSTAKDITKWIRESLDWEGTEDDWYALSALVQTPVMISLGINPSTVNNYIHAILDAVNGEFMTSSAYALNLPPSALKVIEEMNNSESAQAKYRKKYGKAKDNKSNRAKSKYYTGDKYKRK